MLNGFKVKESASVGVPEFRAVTVWTLLGLCHDQQVDGGEEGRGSRGRRVYLWDPADFSVAEAAANTVKQFFQHR